MSDSVFDDGVGLETPAKTSCGATTPAPTMRPQLFDSSRRVKSFDIELNLTAGRCRKLPDLSQLPQMLSLRFSFEGKAKTGIAAKRRKEIHKKS